MIHVMVVLPLLVIACLLQLMPLDFYGPPQYMLFRRFMSPNNVRLSQIVAREGIRFILLAIGGTQLWAGIRDWYIIP